MDARTRSGFRSVLHGLPGQREVNLAQLGQSFGGLAHLPLEELDLLQTLVGGELERMRVRAPGLRLDHLADLGEREAELLALDDQREAIAVRAAKNAPAAVALRRDEPAAVIETQGAQRQAEFL